MKLNDRIWLANLFHDLAQNAITEVLKCYLENVSWVGYLHDHAPRTRNRTKMERSIMENGVINFAEVTEKDLEELNAMLISEMQVKSGEER